MVDIPQQLDVGDSCARIFINDLAAKGKRLSVSLDGVEQQRVVAYDVPGRWVKVQRLRDGKPYAEGSGVATQTLQGAISVSLAARENNTTPFPCSE